MAEEAVVEQPKAPSSVEVITPNANLFSDSMWSANPVVVDPVKTDAPITEVKPEPTTTKPEDAEIVDEMEYLERQTGYKSWDDIKALKAEVEQLRTKAQTPAEKRFTTNIVKNSLKHLKRGKKTMCSDIWILSVNYPLLQTFLLPMLSSYIYSKLTHTSNQKILKTFLRSDILFLKHQFKK